jgi:hypothetical protein
MTREEAKQRLDDGGRRAIVKYRNKRGNMRFGRIVEVMTKWAVVESGDEKDAPVERRRIKIADLHPFHSE